ncbi:MAG: aminoacyl-tRNA hydrolase [Phycisphaerae bacterium]
MKLVAGLGNPGAEYARTRHNVGFMVLNSLAQSSGVAWKSGFDGLYCPMVSGSEKIFLLKPGTYMNCSGRSVGAALRFYGLTIADLLVVVDDIHLPCGTIRLRAGGSSGGHKGLADVQRHLGSLVEGTSQTPTDYARLRVGVDPPDRSPLADYVLSPFSPSQWAVMEVALNQAAEAVQYWALQGVVKAMNRFNVGGEGLEW